MELRNGAIKEAEAALESLNSHNGISDIACISTKEKTIDSTMACDSLNFSCICITLGRLRLMDNQSHLLFLLQTRSGIRQPKTLLNRGKQVDALSGI
jgi:hypothetical protein